jgi:hypothetical protein
MERIASEAPVERLADWGQPSIATPSPSTAYSNCGVNQPRLAARNGCRPHHGNSCVEERAPDYVRRTV